MSTGPANALKAAVIDFLKAAPAVKALVGVKVFDEVPRDARGDPQDAQAPYIYLGPCGLRRMNRYEAAQDWTYALRLYCVSTSFNRDEAWAIAEAALAAFNPLATLPATLAPQDWSMTENRVVTMGDVIAPTAPKEVFLDLAGDIVSQTFFDP